MNRSGNLVYSDDPCSAFMTAIVRSYEENVGGRHYLGRTAVQKVVYFAKVLGVPIPCSFEIYTYGPYSDAVTFCVDSLLADDVLEDTSKDPQSYSNYRLGENADEILNAYRRLIDPHREKIDTVVQSLGSFKPQELELIATLHFIHHRLKQIWRKEPSRDQGLAEFYRVKKDKFSPEEISSWYGALRNARLV
ncbi:MAG: hypothetical protein HY040_27120 [Planctomycetes bacterium]|nr:hypothetical protein [Planctomycetota bacterium]